MTFIDPEASANDTELLDTLAKVASEETCRDALLKLISRGDLEACNFLNISNPSSDETKFIWLMPHYGIECTSVYLAKGFGWKVSRVAKALLQYARSLENLPSEPLERQGLVVAKAAECHIE